MTKLTPINICNYGEKRNAIDKCYTVFNDTILARANRPLLGNKEIFVPLKSLQLKPEIFWHISSLNPHHIKDIVPCVNDIVTTLCFEDCVSNEDRVTLNNGEERTKCLYRAVRVNWIKQLIEMYNNNDNRIKHWKSINKYKATIFYIRYQEDELDYVVVFEEKNNKVVLLTAYPVFFISKKRKLDKAYSTYVSHEN